MSPFNDSLELWLDELLPHSAEASMLDVGAYHADFAQAMVAQGVVGHAHLFEPNPDNQGYLAALCQAKPSFTLHKAALGRERGSCDFYCNQDPATGSVLPYRSAPDSGVRVLRVERDTLDSWWDHAGRPKISLIKIDTQGHDLDVLRGGGNLLAKDRPWLVVEFIFIPLYVNQAKPVEFFAWAEASEYECASLFNEHRSTAGILSFVDAVFIPRESMPPLSTTFAARPSLENLQREITALNHVCQERLALIEYLHGEAEKRLHLIEELTKQVRSPSTS